MFIKNYSKEKDSKERDRETQERTNRKFIFWNIAGIKKKDKEVWKFIGSGDFISLCETWLEEKEWKVWERGYCRKSLSGIV